MLGDKLVIKDILHVTCVEECVRDAVELGVDLGVLDSLRYVFDANHLTGFLSHEVGDGTSACVEVVDHLVACESCELASHTVEVVGLFGIGLVEALGSNLELQVFHRLDDMVFSLEDNDLLITDRIVAFLIIQI